MTVVSAVVEVRSGLADRDPEQAGPRRRVEMSVRTDPSSLRLPREVSSVALICRPNSRTASLSPRPGRDRIRASGPLMDRSIILRSASHRGMSSAGRGAANRQHLLLGADRDVLEKRPPIRKMPVERADAETGAAPGESPPSTRLAVPGRQPPGQRCRRQMVGWPTRGPQQARVTAESSRDQLREVRHFEARGVGGRHSPDP